MSRRPPPATHRSRSSGTATPCWPSPTPTAPGCTGCPDPSPQTPRPRSGQIRRSRRAGGRMRRRCGRIGAWECRRDSRERVRGRPWAARAPRGAGNAGVQVGFRLLRRAAERRQVHADERARRREGGDHQQPPADHPARDPGDRAPAGRPAGDHRYAWPAPAPDAAGERLDSLARSTLTEVDVIGFCVPAPDRIGPGDRYLATELGGIGKTPVVAIITKTDQAPPERVAAQLAAVARPRRLGRHRAGLRRDRLPARRADRGARLPPAAG